MNAAAAGLLGGAVTLAYVPVLRGQIRDGAIGIPYGTINPIVVHRDEHPLAFRLCAIALGACLIMVFVACALVIAEGV